MFSNTFNDDSYQKVHQSIIDFCRGISLMDGHEIVIVSHTITSYMRTRADNLKGQLSYTRSCIVITKPSK